MLVDHLLKIMKEYKTLKKTRDSRYIYKTELDKACFRRSMAHGDFKDLARRTASDKVLIDKVFNIFKNPKYDGYQRDLVSMVYNFLIKNLQVVVLNLRQINNL